MVRLNFLDSLRGVLAVVVVFHHLLCGLYPCLVFGTNFRWLLAETQCQPVSLSTTLLAPLYNGKFAVIVFFTLSGFVLTLACVRGCGGSGSGGVGSEPLQFDKWGVIVIKRFFRLFLPLLAASLFAFFLLPLQADFEKVKSLTQTRWLEITTYAAPSPLSSLLISPLRGGSPLNNAFWTMPLELFGSYLVFVLVPLTWRRSKKARMFVFGLLVLFLMTPSVSLGSNLYVTVDSPSIPNPVVLNPSQHPHILSSLTQGKSEKKWDFVAGTIYQNTSALTPENWNLLQNAKKPAFQLVYETKWSTDIGNIYHVAFIAGVWLCFTYLKKNENGEKVVGVGGGSQNMALLCILGIISYICAAFPFDHAQGLKEANPLFSSMSSFLSLFGFPSPAVPTIIYIIGAMSLIQLTLLSPSLQQLFTSRPLLFLGKISFSLYLLHIPILCTFGLTTFVTFTEYGFLSYNMAALGCATITLFLSVIFAALFTKYIDQPCISYSKYLALWVLDMGEPPLSTEETI